VLLAQSVVASTEVPAVQVVSLPSRQGVPLSEKAHWEWVTNSEKLAQLSLDFAFLLPKKVASASAKFSRVEVLPGGAALRVHLVAVSDTVTVTYADGARGGFGISAVPKGLTVVERGCAKNNLAVRGNKDFKAPLFLGVDCETTDTVTKLTVSAPLDLEWGATSISEERGKAESVRQFSLDMQFGKKGASSLRFEIIAGKEKALFEVMPKVPWVTQSAEDRKRRLRASLALGGWALSLVAPSIDQSSVLPALSSELDFTLSFFRLGFLGKLVLPLPPSQTNISFYSLQFYTAVPFFVGRWSFVPRVLFETLGIDYNPTALSYSFRQGAVGGGLLIRCQLSPTDSALYFEAQQWGLLPASTGSNLVLQLGYDFSRTGMLQYGLQALYQKQTFDAGSGARNFSVLGLNGVLRF
jgi:hypothetical protein